MKIIGPITDIETIAEGSGIRERVTLKQKYGEGNWKKKNKGIAMVQVDESRPALAEVHWYEAHGIGKVKFKVKKWL
jgi:hypothetical protein